MKYVIIEKAFGDEIERFDSLEEALFFRTVREMDDIEKGTFVKDYYAVVAVSEDDE